MYKYFSLYNLQNNRLATITYIIAGQVQELFNTTFLFY